MLGEHRQQAVTGPDGRQELGARSGEVGQPTARARPDGEDPGLYGKMLLRASRIRPTGPGPDVS
jgi:hypothetical protein